MFPPELTMGLVEAIIEPALHLNFLLCPLLLPSLLQQSGPFSLSLSVTLARLYMVSLDVLRAGDCFQVGSTDNHGAHLVHLPSLKDDSCIACCSLNVTVSCIFSNFLVVYRKTLILDPVTPKWPELKLLILFLIAVYIF